MPLLQPFVPGSRISASPVPDVSTSLTDMEQQRRQELLKRKVLASRKRKNPNFDAMPTSLEVARTMYVDTHQLTWPLAPAANVDDFLNSIEPTPASSSSDRALYGVHMGSFSLDIMDVDEIPGLGGSSFTHYAPARERSMDTILTPVIAKPYSIQPVSHGAADEDVASSSDESKKPAVSQSDQSNGSGATERASNGSGASGYTMPMDGVVSDEPPLTTCSFPASVARSGQPLSRRGMKRPVAADFVDADRPHLADPSSRSFQSRTQSTGEVREDGNGHIAKVQHLNPHVRRKMKAVAVGASFAVVSNMRGCVIDVNDTDEDEGVEFDKFALAKTMRGATPVGLCHSHPHDTRYLATFHYVSQLCVDVYHGEACLRPQPAPTLHWEHVNLRPLGNCSSLPMVASCVFAVSLNMGTRMLKIETRAVMCFTIGHKQTAGHHSHRRWSSSFLPTRRPFIPISTSVLPSRSSRLYCAQHLFSIDLQSTACTYNVVEPL